ncbi:DUF2281 domain-containing protein [Gloeocapsa sp. PCC 73106]|uniref:DUF2281 domain-containing protein n=1 Tax=Gloeocapsa sp. PCC 73106 TaxID=102232 RepID=UPI0002AC4936|nr:DUF2281 domain-containing protein [Gloeocapsa sp. PCC 73106]ELR96613.1 hypothetical protein GLO73106DRAFT_00004080 [Gloeocapsa sp. PCC 73106]
MIVLTATSKNGNLILNEPLPANLEGKSLQIFISEKNLTTSKRRHSGSAKDQIWIAPDFDEPLEDFKSYLL